jgi:CDP-glucose 4,6-dehydratase
MEELVKTFSGARILLTGHSGFKGSWLATILHSLGAEVHGFSLAPIDDSLSAYRKFDVPSLVASETFADICDSPAINQTVESIAPEFVFHLAAQALVSTSWLEPESTYRTNVFGTYSLLQALRSSVDTLKSVVVVTSDKVYQNDGTGRSFVETDPLGGADPYSNSKACAELVVAGMRTHFPVSMATARAGNVIGGGDISVDRLVPDVVRAWRASGEGKNPWTVSLRRPDATRPWQHVVEPLAGYLGVARGHAAGINVPPSLNFGPQPDLVAPVREVVEMACQILGSGSWLNDGEPQFEEAPVLGIDPGLAASSLGWVPKFSLQQAITHTLDFERLNGSSADSRQLAVTQFQRAAGSIKSECSVS